MPWVANTPESQLGRTDSKNPETTCRGITSGGRPCRRPLTSSPDGAPVPSPARAKRAQNRLRVDDPSDPDLYCWQHKDQASSSAHSSPGPRRSERPILESRESVDTLIDRLGIVEKQQQQQQQQGGRKSSGHKASGQGAVQAGGKEEVSEQHHFQQRPSFRKKTRSIFCCCFSIPIHEDEEAEEAEQPQPPPRPKPRPVQSAPAPLPAKPYPPSSSRPGSSSLAPPSSGGRSRRPSQTSQFMSLIPGHTSPQTASQLLAELAKPPSAQDEPGYIYIFWLTPESAGAKPPTDAARSLLASSGSDSKNSGSHLRPVDAQRQRRPSDVVANFAASSARGGGGQGSRSRGAAGKDDGGKNGKPKTILLKIGRASNVHRRLTEWQRQCGYELDLIRYYPYVPSSSAASQSNTPAGSRPSSSSTNRRTSGGAGSRPSSSSNANANNSDGVRKTPHSHKVERLVHIELTGLGLRAYGGAGGDGGGGGACEACGRTHREWFEVEASRDGIRLVDEVVRRWCDWDEGRL